DPSSVSSAAVTTTVTVTANRPTAGVRGPASGFSGQPLTFTLSASEAYESAGASYGFTITWGDGSAAEALTGPSGTPLNHVFASADADTVTVLATDWFGNTSAAATASVVVSNRPAASISGPGGGVQGQPLTYTFGASEAGLPANTLYTFAIDWDGNGTVD